MKQKLFISLVLYFNVKSHVDVKFPYATDALSEPTLEMRLSSYSLVYPFILSQRRDLEAKYSKRSF